MNLEEVNQEIAELQKVREQADETAKKLAELTELRKRLEMKERFVRKAKALPKHERAIFREALDIADAEENSGS